MRRGIAYSGIGGTCESKRWSQWSYHVRGRLENWNSKWLVREEARNRMCVAPQSDSWIFLIGTWEFQDAFTEGTGKRTPNQFQVLLVLALLGEQNQQMRLFPTSSSRKYIILHQIRHQSGFILRVQVIEESREDFLVNGMLSVNKIGVSPPKRMSTANVIDSLFSGEDLSVIMVLPVRKDAVVTSPKQGWTPAAITEWWAARVFIGFPVTRVLQCRCSIVWQYRIRTLQLPTRSL